MTQKARLGKSRRGDDVYNMWKTNEAVLPRVSCSDTNTSTKSKLLPTRRELRLAKNTLRVSLVTEKSPGGTVTYHHKSLHLFTVFCWVGKPLGRKCWPQERTLFLLACAVLDWSQLPLQSRSCLEVLGMLSGALHLTWFRTTHGIFLPPHAGSHFPDDPFKP